MNQVAHFKDYFSEDKLNGIYHSKIIHRATVGMDRIIPDVFDKELDKHISIISKKVLAGRYHFTHYREVLISKGRDSNPRVISIPTIRDKVALGALHAFLQDSFRDIVEEPLLHTVIGKITHTIKTSGFDSFVKVDIHRFYSSINHDVLIPKVAQKVKEDAAIALLKSAISTATVPANALLEKNICNVKGVPEGLSISNILADIYLSDLKNIMTARYSIAYFRYVDDILILCKSSDAELIQHDITALIEIIYKLQINDKKTYHGKLADGVPYLGYVFFDDRICVRSGAIQKIENSIEALFRLRSRSAIGKELFAWRLNLKIGGCIYESKKYGWLFYYSQLTDLSVLYHLDWFVDKQFERFRMEPILKRMRFVRTFHEITKNLDDSSYLINIDRYTDDQKRELVHTVQEGKKVPEDSKELEKRFKAVMFKEIQKLEHDIQNFS